MTATDPLAFLYSGNHTYIAQVYERYLDDPGSVDLQWQEFFDSLEGGAGELIADSRGASWSPSGARVVGEDSLSPISEQMTRGMRPNNGSPEGYAPETVQRAMAENNREAVSATIRAIMLIRNYRVRGHFKATLDPLGLEEPCAHSELDPESYGFKDKDYDKEIYLNYVLGLESATLKEILSILERTYCGNIGIEFMHIQEADEKAWLQERMESIQNQTHFTEQGKRAILHRLVETEGFEVYLDKKFTGNKRFGLDGGESLVPAIEQVIKRGGQLGMEELVIGMPHRGRLNVLANVMGKPFQAILAEFQGNNINPDGLEFSGDVKYHLGASADRVFDGHSVHLSLTANPSHLEAVNTVVLGKVRAKQRQRNDDERIKVVGLLMHGDAAFSGQGLVAETFDLANLKGYRTGGTIHFVVNNQIGFTTAPRFSRSSAYCSDVAKIVSAPIFHVNADDPEAVVHCARLAIEYRQRFHKDVVIDMICYRRHGHNEGDEPMFTQPLMYQKIAAHPTTLDIYSKQLEKEGLIAEGEGQTMRDAFHKSLDEMFEQSARYKNNEADWLGGTWSGLGASGAGYTRSQTGVGMERLHEVGLALSRVPDNFALHPRIMRQLTAKREVIENDERKIDWATAEALAFGTLLLDGHPVRLSGQDSGRGTFSQRHSVLVDQKTEERYEPLNNIRYGQAPFEVIDSPLSEAGVLGFEYGISLAEPQMLVLWEGQFGDFANGAQVIIDQFLCSGEAKWLRMSGLVMLLPHGFEGQGPEHSSARLERYLQLSANDNWLVCNCTTPANYFHVLRRQIMRDFRKPLILMTPKSLLRHKLCVSKLSEMSEDSEFHRLLWDDAESLPDMLDGGLVADKDITRVVLCSGKVYYDLLEERQKRGVRTTYLLRVEQLFPFPHDAAVCELKRFKRAEIIWCQEEPRNMGSWHHIREPLEAALADAGRKTPTIHYVGRAASASPATGLMSIHVAEQKALVNEALEGTEKGALATPKSANKK